MYVAKSCNGDIFKSKDFEKAKGWLCELFGCSSGTTSLEFQDTLITDEGVFDGLNTFEVYVPQDRGPYKVYRPAGRIYKI